MAISCNNRIKRLSQGLLFKNGAVFFSAFLLCFPLSLAGTITAIEDPVLAGVGDDATLVIRIDERVGTCTWYRGAVQNSNIILRITNGNQTEGPKYTHRESLLQPSHSLRIAKATLEDNGTYSVLIVFTSFSQDLSSITLKVQDAPEPHHLSAGAIAGIVIAVIVGAGAITGLIYYIVTKTGVTRGSGSSGLNEMNSKPTYNTGDKGAENQFVQEEPQYSSPTFKPSSPISADTTINSSTDKTVYALVNAPKR